MVTKRKRVRTSAFTLIELLVVIAIIALLMGILMPALSLARKQARGAACLSQIKHWGVIWQMYFDDHEGKMPDVQLGLGTQGGWNRGFWVTVLAPQWEKRPKILLCPSATKTGTRMQGDYDIIGSYDQAYNHGLFNYRGAGGEVLENLMSSYGMNLFACSTPVDVQGRKQEYHFQNQNKLRNTGEIPLFLDAMWRGGGPHWDGTEDISPPIENGHWVGYGHEMKHFAMDRHGGGVNVLFADGSARKVLVKDLWDLRWHVDYPIHRARQQPDSWWGPWLSKK
ncbi:MAG: prepilin-type N-terminal cleavage/methylation domain-containing protein [Planctomycetota bacterium]|jgi:prepilin-type processing-associated H-X9-DG protein/prepilin-type N-terminal cleavage/methylation domain-containing protein